MKLISWNVAGLRACLKKGFEDYFYAADADIFCIQESKLTQEQLLFHPAGYHEYLFPAQVKKGYSGTLIYAKPQPLAVRYGIGDEEYDGEGRIITLTYDTFSLVNVYVPNTKRDLSRLPSRMRFQEVFQDYLCGLRQHGHVVVCGDFNVAHEEIDIRNVKSNIGNAGFTYEEREKMTALLGAGFADTFRRLHPETVQYTWWSYMGHAREKNIGWRLDYFLTDEALLPAVRRALIHDEVMGSDHCPIELELDL